MNVLYPLRCKKAGLFAAVTMLAMTTLMPVQAEKPKTPTSFEEKKEQKLGKAEAKLKKAQARVDCIKAATEMKALKQCK